MNSCKTKAKNYFYTVFFYQNHFAVRRKIVKFANVIELERHIEILLLNNDCVIVPEFGGFMAQHIDARYSEVDNTFLPPIRTIGFNPQLKINDSLLAQSYVEAYDISYPEALRRIEQEVEEIRQILSTKGEYELRGIGILRINTAGNYEFEPCEAGLLTPSLYGLGAFEFETLESIDAKQITEETIPQHTAKIIDINENKNNQSAIFADINDNNDSDSYTIKKSVIRNIAVACIAIMVFLLVPSHLGNGTKSALTTSKIDTGLLYRIMPKDITTGNAEIEAATRKVLQKNEIKKPVIIEKKNTAAQDYYTIVLASKVSINNAKAYTEKLKKEGYTAAEVYSGHGNTKVIYGNYSNKKAAQNALNSLNSNNIFADGWVTMVRK